jgi:hypothetical protein
MSLSTFKTWSGGSYDCSSVIETVGAVLGAIFPEVAAEIQEVADRAVVSCESIMYHYSVLTSVYGDVTSVYGEFTAVVGG